MINDMGITVCEIAPETDSLILSDDNSSADDDAADEAAAVLASVDGEFGRTTDPVRMYMREMGTVELLTREGEIEIAKRIEDGLQQVLLAVGTYPETVSELLRRYSSLMKMARKPKPTLKTKWSTPALTLKKLKSASVH